MNLTVKVRPRRIFLPLFEEGCPRFTVVVAHRRAGKTTMAAQRLIRDALACKKPNGRFGYIAPLRHQAKTVAWDLMKRMTRAVPGRKVNEAELRIDLPNDSRINLFGADNPDALRGGYLDGVVLDEIDQMTPTTWPQVVRPMLADRLGWAIFIGTPMGRQQLFDFYTQARDLNDWGAFRFRASETGLVPLTELEAACLAMGREAYEQEFECSWDAAVKGAFYAREIAKLEDSRLMPINIDPVTPVITGWDLGTRDATAIWVMQRYMGNAFALVDYYENAGYGVDHYAGWLRECGYITGEHWAPHDISNTDWSSAGGLNRKEVALQHGVRFERAPRAKNAQEVMEGINAVRLLIPRMYFHDDNDERGQRVRRGRLALSLYRQAYNERLSALQANPVHDWTSHAADAMRTLVYAVRARDTSNVEPNTGRPRGHGLSDRRRAAISRSQRGREGVRRL